MILLMSITICVLGLLMINYSLGKEYVFISWETLEKLDELYELERIKNDNLSNFCKTWNGYDLLLRIFRCDF